MLKGIEINPATLSGTDTDTWGAIADIKAGGFPMELPDPLMVCGHCGRTWMREYEKCPICESAEMLPYRQQTPPAQ